MPTQDVLASPLTRRERADRDFRDLFVASFPAIGHAVQRIVGDRSVADEITRDAFFRLLTHWRTIGRSEAPDEWVRREALEVAVATGATGAAQLEAAGLADWDAGTERAYEAVVGRARRRTAHRKRAVVGAGAVAVAVVAGWLVQGGGPPPEADPPDRAPVAVGAPPWVTGRGYGSAERELPRAALDGRWRTGPISRADVERALGQAGFGEYADYAGTFPTGPFRIDLTVRAGRSVLAIAGDQRYVAILRVEGNRVTLEQLPPNVGYTHFRSTRDHGRLSLRFTGTGLAKASHDAFPAEVYQVALYAAAPFTRL